MKDLTGIFMVLLTLSWLAFCVWLVYREYKPYPVYVVSSKESITFSGDVEILTIDKNGDACYTGNIKTKEE